MTTTGYTFSLRDVTQPEVRRLNIGRDFFESLGSDAQIKNGNLDATVTLEKVSRMYKVRFEIRGTAEVTCDRCLDTMQQAVEVNEEVWVHWNDGTSEAEAEDALVVEDAEGWFDFSWLMYELIYLGIPTRHIHAEGECNPEMEAQLKAHSASGDGIDPRWKGLEALKQ